MGRFELRDLETAREFVGELAYTEWGREQLAKKFRALASELARCQQADTSVESLEETKAGARNAALKEEVQFLKAREKQLLVDLADSESREEEMRDEIRDLLDRGDVLGLEFSYCQKIKSEMALRILQLKAALYDYMQKERSEADES